MISGLVVLIHNKATDAENRQQITFFVNNTTVLDADRASYTINGIAIEHEIYFLQIIPEGTTPPTNRDLLNSYKIYYGNDQPSIDRRFFNVAIRRASQFGMDLAIVITDHTLITLADFRDAMQEIAGTKILVQRTWGWVFETRIFERIAHQLTEQGMTLAQALAEMKQRITDAGYTYG